MLKGQCFGYIALNKILKVISPVFLLFNVATRKLKTTHMAHVVFLLNCTGMENG